MTTLLVLLRVHDRQVTTRIVLDEIERYKILDPDRLRVKLAVMADRPSRAVEKLVDKYPVLQAPRPMLDRDGEHFLENQNAHLEFAEKLTDDPSPWVYVHDDDFWLEPPDAYSALLPALRNEAFDAYFLRCIFFQDDFTHQNPARTHRSIRIFRHVPGTRHSGLRMLSMPDATHDSAIVAGRTADFPVPLLEYGGFTEKDRVLVVDRYALAGKDDAFTRALYDTSRAVYVPRIDRLRAALQGFPCPIASSRSD